MHDARRNKERVYLELTRGGRCRLVVLGIETGGRWSEEACTFLRLLAQHRARQATPLLRQAVAAALLHRWSAMLTHAAFTAYAASLQGLDSAPQANIDGDPLPRPTPTQPSPLHLTHPLDFANLGTGQDKNCQQVWGQASIKTVITTVTLSHRPDVRGKRCEENKPTSYSEIREAVLSHEHATRIWSQEAIMKSLNMKPADTGGPAPMEVDRTEEKGKGKGWWQFPCGGCGRGQTKGKGGGYKVGKPKGRNKGK